MQSSSRCVRCVGRVVALAQDAVACVCVCVFPCMLAFWCLHPHSLGHGRRTKTHSQPHTQRRILNSTPQHNSTHQTTPTKSACLLPACVPTLSLLHVSIYAQLELAVKTQQADFVDVRVADALRQVSDLELMQVCAVYRACRGPAGWCFSSLLPLHIWKCITHSHTSALVTHTHNPLYPPSPQPRYNRHQALPSVYQKSMPPCRT